MKHTLITIAILLMVITSYSQTTKPSGLITSGGYEVHKHVYTRVDTIKGKPQGLFGGISYRLHKPYMYIVLEKDGKKLNDTVVNDSLNTIRYLLREVDKERATIQIYDALILRLHANSTDKKTISILKKLGYNIKH